MSELNIIVRMPNWLGDIVMATPVLKAIKTQFPKCRLTAMCQYPGSMLLAHDPHLDELFAFKKQKPLFFRRDQQRSITEKLRIGNYDLGILLTNSVSSAWWFYQGGVKKRVGYGRFFRRILLTDAFEYPDQEESIHQVEIYLKLLEGIGIQTKKSEPYLTLSFEAQNQMKKKLKHLGIVLEKKKIGVVMGASYGQAKCWPKESFFELMQYFQNENPQSLDQFIFIGDMKQKQQAEEICERFPHLTLNLCGKTSVYELMHLIGCLDLVITNDSGPMHIAAACGVPVVALFGSTSPTKTGPYRKEGVLYESVTCSPCYRRTCPIDFSCMKGITVEKVVDKIRRQLKG